MISVSYNSRKNTGLAATAALLILSVACVPVDGETAVNDPIRSQQSANPQQYSARTNSKILELEQKLARLQAQNPKGTLQQVEGLKKEVAELQGKVDALSHAASSSTSFRSKSFQSKNFRNKSPAVEPLAEIKTIEKPKLEKHKHNIVRSDSAPDHPITDAIKEVNQKTKPHSAQKLFEKKKYLSASQEARKVLDSNKTNRKQKSEAQFWLAKSQMKLGNFETSALKFNQYLEGKYDDQSKSAEARFLLGEIFHKLGQNEVGNIYYKEVVELHKGTKLASRAKRKIR